MSLCKLAPTEKNGQSSIIGIQIFKEEYKLESVPGLFMIKSTCNFVLFHLYKIHNVFEI